MVLSFCQKTKSLIRFVVGSNDNGILWDFLLCLTCISHGEWNIETNKKNLFRGKLNQPQTLETFNKWFSLTLFYRCQYYCPTTCKLPTHQSFRTIDTITNVSIATSICLLGLLKRTLITNFCLYWTTSNSTSRFFPQSTWQKHTGRLKAFRDILCKMRVSRIKTVFWTKFEFQTVKFQKEIPFVIYKFDSLS